MDDMNGMDHGHGHSHGMPGTMSPPPPNGTASSMMPHHKMMMHMTFFWGKDSLILFSGWPGTNSGMYFLALLFVFVLSILVEWLTHNEFVKNGSNHVAAGLVQTMLHAVRVGLAYMVMLAVMSFNVGVFLVVVAGHGFGFLLFGSRMFKKSIVDSKESELTPLSC